MLTLAISNWLLVPGISLFIIVSIVLILLVLIQKGRGGGLIGAFGGMGGNTPFGSKTGDVITWATSIVFGIFLLLAIVLNLMTQSTAIQKAQNQTGYGATSRASAPSGSETQGG